MISGTTLAYTPYESRVSPYESRVYPPKEGCIHLDTESFLILYHFRSTKIPGER
jgi:hypothetical protein